MTLNTCHLDAALGPRKFDNLVCMYNNPNIFYSFWTLGPNWPKGGEIDILEGVNEYTNNGMTLHTGPGCQIGSDTTQFSGSVTTGNCDVNAEDQSKNAGCSIEHPSTQSYGAGLNQNGGGVYATKWTSESIQVFFFPRGSIPKDIRQGNPEPDQWGQLHSPQWHHPWGSPCSHQYQARERSTRPG